MNGDHDWRSPGGGGVSMNKKIHVGETVSPMRVFFSMWALSFLST